MALLLAPTAADAQAIACALPKSIPAPAAPNPGESVRAPVTGYLLALSWSPEFCRARADEPRHRLQCGGEMGRFGFILHGLWPDASGRADPGWCRAAALPDPATIREHLCTTPSPDLLAREWAKHGTCGFADAPSYFRAGSRLFGALRFPDMNALSRRQTTAADLRRAFVARNPAIPPDAIGIVANRRQWLQEVRLCLGRDFRPRACAPEDRGVRNIVPVKVWRGR